MKISKQYWVEFVLVDEQTGKLSYAGNIDEVVCATLTGHGSDRYGEEYGIAQFKELVKPNLDFHPDDIFENFSHDEYGSVPYSLGEIDYNHLRMKISDSDFEYPEQIEKLTRLVDLAKTITFTFPDSDLRVRLDKAIIEKQIISKTNEEI